MEINPRNASEALRLAKMAEAVKKGEFTLWPQGDGVILLDSWKTAEDGKKQCNRYEVNLAAWTCSCPDFQKNGLACKHLFFCEEKAREEAMCAEADSCELLSTGTDGDYYLDLRR